MRSTRVRRSLWVLLAAAAAVAPVAAAVTLEPTAAARATDGRSVNAGARIIASASREAPIR